MGLRLVHPARQLGQNPPCNWEGQEAAPASRREPEQNQRRMPGPEPQHEQAHRHRAQRLRRGSWR
jgi:hypothetical protein